MVKIRVGAGIPLEYFSQMAQEAIERALATSEAELAESFRRAVELPKHHATEGADLIVNQLAKGRENDAIYSAKQIIDAIDASDSRNVSIIWSQFMMFVIPAAVSLGHDNFVNRVTDFASASPTDQSATFALCGQAYLARASYEAAAEFLYRAIDFAKKDALLETDLLHLHLAACLKPLGREQEFAHIQDKIERLKEEEEQRERAEIRQHREAEELHLQLLAAEDEAERNAEDTFLHRFRLRWYRRQCG